MPFFRQIYLFSFLLISSLALASNDFPFGRYLGVLNHGRLKADQIAKLDLIFARKNVGNIELIGILTLHLGDYASKEYASYHFDNVIYDLANQVMTFQQTGQGITMKLDTRKLEEGELSGTLRSSLHGTIGPISLRKDREAKPTHLLIEPLWGEYRGICNKVEKTLQLYTYRSIEEAFRSGDPFKAYDIKGKLGVRGKGPEILHMCDDLPDYPPCVINRFDSGSYDFFRGELTLFGRPKNASCTVNSDGIQCDGCPLKRISKETSGPRVFTPPTSESVFGKTTHPEADGSLKSSSEEIEGEYRGYLHHEYLNKYQVARLNIVTFQEPSGGGTKFRMSAVARIYFGDETSTEFLTYEFTERSVPLSSSFFTFKQPENDVDAVLQVTSFDPSSGEIRGVWYSMLFGRVGTFVLSKNTVPALPRGAKMMDPIGGEYKSKVRAPFYWNLSLTIGKGRSALLTENPFLPNFIGGYVNDGIVNIPNTPIRDGSFDFYTGRIALPVGENDWLAVGDRTSRSELSLRFLSLKKFGGPMGEHRLYPFEPK